MQGRAVPAVGCAARRPVGRRARVRPRRGWHPQALAPAQGAMGRVMPGGNSDHHPTAVMPMSRSHTHGWICSLVPGGPGGGRAAQGAGAMLAPIPRAPSLAALSRPMQRFQLSSAADPAAAAGDYRGRQLQAITTYLVQNGSEKEGGVVVQRRAPTVLRSGSLVPPAQVTLPRRTVYEHPRRDAASERSRGPRHGFGSCLPRNQGASDVACMCPTYFKCLRRRSQIAKGRRGWGTHACTTRCARRCFRQGRNLRPPAAAAPASLCLPPTPPAAPLAPPPPAARSPCPAAWPRRGAPRAAAPRARRAPPCRPPHRAPSPPRP
jgi:hypothetical protein